jgi:rhodanese-related sulfurtransferase
MTIAQLKQEMKENKELIILDVRQPEEFVGNLAKIPEAINIPLPQLEQRINEMEAYRENKIAVICRSGVRSRTATNILMGSGYNAINVDGGMMAYAQE